MRKLFSILFALMISASVLTVSAKETAPEYRLELGKEYTVAKADDVQKAAELFGLPQEQMTDYIQKNNVALVAAKKDGTVRLVLTAEQNSFSKKAVSFADYTPKDLEPLMLQFLGEGISGSLVSDGKKLPYFRLHSTAQDETGTYTITQFLTVWDETQYTLLVESDAQNEENLPDSLFRTLTVGHPKEAPSPLPRYLVLIGIAAFSLLALWCLVKLVGDFKQTEEPEE